MAKVIPLLVAIGVIGLAQEPEGTVALARRQTRYVLDVLRPLPGAAPAVAGGAAAHRPRREPGGDEHAR